MTIPTANQPYKFRIERRDDQSIVRSFEDFLAKSSTSLKSVNVQAMMVNSKFSVKSFTDSSLNEVTSIGDYIIQRFDVSLNNGINIVFDRPIDESRALKGNADFLSLEGSLSLGEFGKLSQLARNCFKATDAKPYADYLDESTKTIYETREIELQRLERMQEKFLETLVQFSAKQIEEQQNFQRRLEEEFAKRQLNNEESHQKRLEQIEQRETELAKIRAEIDDSENRTARRDIYKGLKAKIESRNTSFELTEGTKARRKPILIASITFLSIFGLAFLGCLIANYYSFSFPIMGAQLGFALAFIGFATFLIRWNQWWFQKHAEEEFRLKRFDLDLDRANWLVELTMEWQNIVNSPMPTDLAAQLAKNLFSFEEAKEMDIHPAETVLSSLLGKDGSLNVEPGKLTISRNAK
jgi:hypothetical protein